MLLRLSLFFTLDVWPQIVMSIGSNERSHGTIIAIKDGSFFSHQRGTQQFTKENSTTTCVRLQNIKMNKFQKLE